MRILYLAIGDVHNPGVRHRILWHVPHLEARGHRVEVRVPVGASLASRRARSWLRPLDLARDLGAAAGHDVVVVYRKTFPGRTARWLRARAPRIAYELDDAVFLPSPAEPQDAATRDRYRRNFAATLAAADLVIAGNRTLAAEAGAKPVAIVPTPVDLGVFRPELVRPHAGFVVGWVGTADNLPQWEALVPAFRRVVARAPHVRFKVIANREPAPAGLPVAYERFTLEREAACLGDIDVGLMPLTDTPWNRGKCSAKALHCMAMGHPVVISPVGMNRDVVQHGRNGLFATGEDEWVEALVGLAASPERVARMGKEARRTVAERYALEAVSPRLAGALEELARPSFPGR